jgi:hypothetical protein
LWREQDLLRQELQATLHAIWQGYMDIGESEEAAKWEKAFFQVGNCQSLWVGYRAGCCNDRTRPIAVPVGCNHRLCPLCAHQRSTLARVRIKTLFDRLTHPALITLTIPSLPAIRKHSFTLVRQKVRKFIAHHKNWIKGGVYSLETTFNRREKTWHLHCHILADLATSLPPKEEKTLLAGSRVCLFTAIKLQLEFDWLRLWSKSWGRKSKKSGEGEQLRMAEAGESFEFESWVAEGRENRLKEWTPAGYRPIQGLSAAELARRTAWNQENRRVIDIRPVHDREGAAVEVLKYLTKCAAFSDWPAAVDEFCRAAKGARMIQTFGSWYGVALDTVFDPQHMDDWGHLKCTCGLNHWEPMGMFTSRDVVWGEAGRWYLKRSIDRRCRGTVPRPPIRFEIEPEETEDSEWQTR